MGKQEIIREFEKRGAKKAPKFSVGDTVDVHVRIVEEGKKRVQVYTGVVIARRGAGNRETFTVRKVSFGEGIERIFPVYSPSVEKVVVAKKGEVRRAKLYYLRKKFGKKAKIEGDDLYVEKDDAPAEALPVREESPKEGA